MAFTNVQSDSDFVKIHFSRFFFWILEFCNNLQKRCNKPWFARPAHPLQDVHTQSDTVICINTAMEHQNDSVLGRFAKPKQQSILPCLLSFSFISTLE